MIIKNATVFLNSSGFVNADVRIENGVFAEFSQDMPSRGQDVLDAQGSYLIPGLVYIHFHGAVGADFSDSNARGEAKLCAVNLEGPFIFEHKLGAQNPAFVHRPDIDFFDRLQSSRVRPGGGLRDA